MAEINLGRVKGEKGDSGVGQPATVDKIGGILSAGDIEVSVDGTPNIRTSVYNSFSELEQEIQKLFTFANNGKHSIATAIGAPASESDTFMELSRIITKGKSNLRVAIEEKGGSVVLEPTFQELEDGLREIPRGNSGLNLFTQIEEPESKAGIWIKTERKHEKVITDDKTYLPDTWAGLSETIKLTFDVYEGIAINTGQEIFIWGGSHSDAYFLDLNNLSWTSLALSVSGTSYWLYAGCTAQCIDGDIYMFGLRTSSVATRAYAIKISKEKEISSIKSTNRQVFTGSSVSFDGDIYIYGAGESGAERYVLKYSLESGCADYFQLPYTFVNGSICIIGTYVYLFGGKSNSTKLLRHNLMDNTTTYLKDIPVSHISGDVVAIGTDIYLFASTGCFVYDTITDSYKSIDSMINASSGFKSVIYGNRILVFGGSSEKRIIREFALAAKKYDEDAFVILRGSENHGKYCTEIISSDEFIEGNFTRFKSGFDNAWIYCEDDLQELPSYYGTGEEWIKFKN